MPAGPLRRALAFQVSPRQTTGFTGGDVGRGSALASTLDSAYDQSGLDRGPAVTFMIDPSRGSRAHPVRDALIEAAFARAAAARAAGVFLSTRLGSSLDLRSKPTLLIISVHSVANPDHRRVVLWTFPQQDVFQFGGGATAPSIKVVEAFVRESKLRKAAVFSGGQTRVDFLEGRVLDLQASNADRAVADLWIVKFLEARIQMSADEGTRLLARTLRHTHDRFSEDMNAQAQIQAVIGSLRNTRASRVSLSQIAARDMTEEVAKVFRAAVRNDDALRAAFPLNKELFDELIQYRIFRLDNGVWVSSPFSEIGEAVTLQGRHLVARGNIEHEQVRSRHG